jgi:hypothetical protein
LEFLPSAPSPRAIDQPAKVLRPDARPRTANIFQADSRLLFSSVFKKQLNGPFYN